MRLAVPALLAILSASAAAAGGYTAPVADVAPVVVAPAPAQPEGWQGFYVGGALGYAFNGDDRVGVRDIVGGVPVGPTETLDANLRVNGGFGGVQLGYRWQYGDFVIGPELSYEVGDVSDGATLIGGTETWESDVNHLLTLRLKAGRVVAPQTLLYGSAGYTRGDFTYRYAGADIAQDQDYTANGYTVGLGVERKLTPRISAFGEWNYHNFGRTDIDVVDDLGDGSRTIATPSHQRLKMGLNFKF